MTAVESKIEERMPVWRALSEFFLDTTLIEEDCDRIAKILASSSYTEAELDEILRYEVLPVCQWNLISMVGEWAAFDDEWLRVKLGPLIDRRPWYWRYVFRQEIDSWPSVRTKIAALRTNDQKA